MNLSDHVDAKAVLDVAFAKPALNPVKAPTLEDAARITAKVTKDTFIDAMSNHVNVLMLDAVAAYEVINGEYQDIPADAARALDEYEGGIDDAVENCLEPLDPYLSADWLGRSTIDTELWLDTDDNRSKLDKLATSTAKEVYKAISEGKSANQILTSAGVTSTDLEYRLANPKEKDMSDEYNEVIGKIKAHIGADADVMEVISDLDMICTETDEILVSSACARLGITTDDVDPIISVALLEAEAVDRLWADIDAFKPKSKRAAARKAKEDKAAETEAEFADAVAPSVLTALKNCGVKDTEMAEMLGVSRTTYTNWYKGKTPFKPDEAQARTMHEELVKRTNELLEAFCVFTKVEVMAVA